jgi:RHS repeat-associated protein
MDGENAYPGNYLPRFQFTGQEWDSYAGLDYYKGRWYDTVTGRFFEQDPIGFSAGDRNLYRYVGNGPTNGTDPTGLLTVQVEKPNYRGLGVVLNWKASFELGADEKNGFLIQKVTVDFERMACDKMQKSFYTGSSSDAPKYSTDDRQKHSTYSYWEMWDVQDGEVIIGKAGKGRGPGDKKGKLEDVFNIPSAIGVDLKKLCVYSGYTIMSGEIAWVGKDNKTMEDYAEWSKISGYPSGSLYYSKDEPSIWKGAKIVASRNISTNWLYMFGKVFYDTYDWSPKST